MTIMSWFYGGSTWPFSFVVVVVGGVVVVVVVAVAVVVVVVVVVVFSFVLSAADNKNENGRKRGYPLPSFSAIVHLFLSTADKK